MTPCLTKFELIQQAQRFFKSPFLAEQIAGFMIEIGLVSIRQQPSNIVAEHRVRAVADMTTIDGLLDHIEDQQRRYQTAVLSPQQSQDVVRILSTLRDSLRISLG